LGDDVKENDWRENFYKWEIWEMFAGSDVKRPLGRRKSRWVVRSKMDITEIRWSEAFLVYFLCDTIIRCAVVFRL
jgi:hypothetical protein